jgi:hypothetical protein
MPFERFLHAFKLHAFNLHVLFACFLKHFLDAFLDAFSLSIYILHILHSLYAQCFFLVFFYMFFLGIFLLYAFTCFSHAFYMRFTCFFQFFFYFFFYMLRHAFNFKCSLHLMWQKVHAEDTCGHVARHVLHFVPGEEAIKGMVAVQAGRGTQLALFFGAGTQQCLDHV